MKKLIIFIMLSALLLSACSNEFNPKAPYEYADDGTWEGIFSGFWHGMNENYVFWDVDDTDWDEVYKTYLPLFQELGKYDNDDDKNEKAARYFYDIVTGLSDGHLSVNVNLKDDMFDRGVQKFRISPGLVRLAKRTGTTDDEIFDAVYGTNDFTSNILRFLPEETMREKTQNILSYVYGFSFLKDNNALKESIKDNSDHKNTEGYTVLLYSNRLPEGGTVRKNWGNVKYYSLNEVLGENASVNDCFSSWTLMIVLNTSLSSDGNETYTTAIDAMAFAGLTKDSNIVYTTFSGFVFSGLIQDESTKPGTYGFLSDFHDIKANPDAIGMVVDVRGNGGGYNLDREYLFGDIMKENHLFGYQKTKTGDNRLDYSALLPVYIHPEAETLRSIYGTADATHLYDKPFAAVTNCFSVSNAEMTVLLAKSMQKGCQIGGTTFGGQGTLSGTYLDLNAGKFTVGNYISEVYTPFAQIVDINGVSHEGIGCEPDIKVDFVKDAFENGDDNRLQKAFDWVKTESTP
ncbi:MAG: S41 family peptidase [Bullifex sp.]|nr:S41 family peptidase [Bullifex sp.]